MLHKAKEQGLREREKIAASCSNPTFALRYFTEYIHYDCGEEEDRGIKLFQELLKS